MEKMTTYFQKWTTPKNAFIALAGFGLSALVIQFLDKPLMDLTGGQPKLDLRFGYNLATIQRLFQAYGAQGRIIYVWNLVADMFLPLFGALTGVLWVLPAVHSPACQRLLIALPLVFGVTDLIENAMLFSLIESFPALPAGLVTITCLITQVKRSAYYITAAEIILCLIFLAAVRLRRTSSLS